MNYLTLDLNPQPASPFLRFLLRSTLLLVGVINLLQAVIMHNAFRYVSLLAGISVVMVVALYGILFKARTLSFGSEFILLTVGGKQEANIHWSEIQSVLLEHYSLILVTKTGQTIKVNISGITMLQEEQTIPDILVLARSKNVGVDIS